MEEIKLGYKCKDIVTGFTGTVTAITKYLTGCDRAVLTPDVDKDGKIPEGCGFDVTSLKVIN